MVDTMRQAILSTTAAEIIQLDIGRTAFAITNTDTAITVYIGDADVSATQGYPIYPRDEIRFIAAYGDNTVIQRYMVAASGNPVVAIAEEHARG